ncbi:hypothetical protein G7Y89_g4415 [Cudoniella acicularis]|uniref:MARVEL domain-containing protein n=1 Tax=Cudoniella acicularis TaxID=354080 RepID=A0A8H4W4B3_9HELO|nr:hypothetical protein G7Y89_g4415 [Cudoniella acicularis]
MEALRHERQYGSGSAISHNYPRKERVTGPPHIVRVIIRIFALIVAASITGVLGHAAAVWFSTQNVIQQQDGGYRQRAWPANLDLWPTWVMLGAAVVAIFIQLLSLLTLCGCFHRLHESHLRNWAVFFTSLLGIAAWIVAAVYFKTQDTKGKTSWDLWSWSCSHKSLENGKMSFETMCVEMNFTFYASIVVAVLEIASLAIFGRILRKGRKVRQYSRITVEKI